MLWSLLQRSFTEVQRATVTAAWEEHAELTLTLTSRNVNQPVLSSTKASNTIMNTSSNAIIYKAIAVFLKLEEVNYPMQQQKSWTSPLILTQQKPSWLWLYSRGICLIFLHWIGLVGTSAPDIALYFPLSILM